MVRMGDRIDDRVEVSRELGVIARDLLLPDPGEQHHRATIPVDYRCQDGVIGHAGETAAAFGPG